MSQPTHLDAVRTFYDTIATDYAERFRAEPANGLGRAMLAAFAELVRAAGGGPVADLGCGPGNVTAHLRSLGLDALGIDLSPAMVELARRTHPGVRFEEGSMHGLDLADGALAGAAAWYSLVHTPPERLPEVLAEIHRVLAPGGHLLLGFQVGEEPLLVSEPFGHPVSLEFLRWSPERVAGLLERAGFTVVARLLREPDEGERVPQAYLLARRPGRS